MPAANYPRAPNYRIVS